MGLLRRIADAFRPASKQLTAPVSRKSVMLSYPAELFFNIAPGSTEDAPIGARKAYRVFALAYACMTFRATKLAEPPVWIAEEDADGEHMLEGDHPLAALLEQPNPDMEMSDLLEQVSLYLDATGACLLVKNQTLAGQPGSMYPYAADEFSVEPGNGRLFGVFRVQTLSGYVTLGADDVIYLKRPSTEHIMKSVAPMDAALAHINLSEGMRTAIKAAMRHAVRPGSIITAPGMLGDDAFDRLKMEIQETYGGVWNSGKSMLLEGGATAEIQRATLEDLALGPIQDDVEAAVCQAFQIHPLLVGSKFGLSASSGFADSLKPALELFYDLAVFPTWARIEKAFTKGLLRPVDDNPLRFIRFDTSKVRSLQEDMTEKIAQAKAAETFWTEEEQRAWTGKEGGSAELPSDKAQRQADQQAAQLQAANDAAAQQNDPNAAKELPFEPSHKSLNVLRGKDAIDVSPATLSSAWHAFDTKAQRQESAYKSAAIQRFDAEREAVAELMLRSAPHLGGMPSNFKANGSEPPEDRAEWAVLGPYIDAAMVTLAARYAANGAYHAAWERAYKALIAQTMQVGGKDIAAEIGISFNLTNPRVQGAIQRRVVKLAGHVTETTLQRVRDVIAKARADGVGVREVAKRIRRDAFDGEISASRALTIARTETVGALNEGEHLAALESGVMKSKRWVSQKDAKVRDSHAAEDSDVWVPIHAPYPVTGLMYPHEAGAPASEVINCRCAQAFTDLAPNEANAAPKADPMADVMQKLAERIAAPVPPVNVQIAAPEPMPPAKSLTVTKPDGSQWTVNVERNGA